MLQELTRKCSPIRVNDPIIRFYDGVLLKTSLRIDLMVEDLVLVELKAVEKHPKY